MAPSVANKTRRPQAEIAFENSLQVPERPQPLGFAPPILVVANRTSRQPMETAWLMQNGPNLGR